jgi:hypothetical protein
MRWPPAEGFSAHLIYPTSLANRKFERCTKSVSDKSKRVNDVALPNPVPSHQKRKGCQLQLALFNALELPKR